MGNDHTLELEVTQDQIKIHALDNCSFYAHHEGSVIIVKLCVFCKYSKFEGKEKNGYCQLHVSKTNAQL